jgi:triosephosphate isomerase
VVVRRPLIAGNWKMNLTHREAIALVQKLAFSLDARQLQAVEVVVLPPFVAIRSVQTLVDGDQLSFGYGAQDLSARPNGAYTGDVSGSMLAALGCQYVVVGHSERREHHGEDDAAVNAKLTAALDNGLAPILCVGEGLPVREARGHVAHCLSQLDAALAGVGTDRLGGLVIAYEPVWAIGTGEVATPEDAQEMCLAVRGRLRETRSAALADGMRILYGGSVKVSNTEGIVAQPDVDGALVGGASLDADEFAGICRLSAGG